MMRCERASSILYIPCLINRNEVANLVVQVQPYAVNICPHLNVCERTDGEMTSRAVKFFATAWPIHRLFIAISFNHALHNDRYR